MVNILDKDAFRKIAAIEGHEWLKQQAQRMAQHVELNYNLDYTFVGVLRAFAAFKAEVDAFDQNVIYGTGGWARYVVREDGEIVYLKSHGVRANAVAEAGFHIG